MDNIDVNALIFIDGEEKDSTIFQVSVPKSAKELNKSTILMELGICGQIFNNVNHTIPHICTLAVEVKARKRKAKIVNVNGAISNTIPEIYELLKKVHIFAKIRLFLINILLSEFTESDYTANSK